MTALKKCGLFSLLLLTSIFSICSAEQMSNLYQASWPVADQSVASREKGLANSFAQVLVRASGSTDVVSSPVIAESISNANRYMRQYSYQKLSIEEQAIYQMPLLLNASFDSQAVLKLLKDAGKPIWSDNRPVGSFWIGIEHQGRRMLVSDGQNEVSIALKRAAELRGLPISIPLMDLEDETSVSIADVWGRLPQAVKRASERYSAEYTVSGQLSFSNSANSWRGSWLVQFGSEHLRFSSQGADITQTIEGLVNRIANHLSSKLAVILSDVEHKVYLEVENVTDLKAYALTRNYLQSLSMVKAASAIELSQDKVLFEVVILSEPHYLIETLKVSKNLYRINKSDSYQQPAVDPISGQQGLAINHDNEFNAQKYHYRWVD